MTCHRCGGLMLAEQYDDLHDYMRQAESLGWRCVNCGAVAPDGKSISFAFLDATNMKSPDDPHISRVRFDLQDKNHVTQVWGWSDKGKEMELTLKPERAK